MVDLCRAAEVLSASKGRKAVSAARQMLEAGAALGAITLTGDSAYLAAGGAVWNADVINTLDYPDIEFRWTDELGEPGAQAMHVAPSGNRTIYRRLRMREADLEILRPHYETWLDATARERHVLAHQWWGPAADPQLVQPSEKERF